MVLHKKRALVIVTILIILATGMYGLSVYYIIPKYITNTSQTFEFDYFSAAAYSIAITLFGLGLYLADYLDLIDF